MARRFPVIKRGAALAAKEELMGIDAERKGVPPDNPRVARGEFIRLTHGAGLSLFGYVTCHGLEEVLTPGYFDAVRDGLERHDRIELTADCSGAEPHHATLVVTAIHPERSVEVAVLKR